MHSLMGSTLPVLFTTNLMDTLTAVTNFPLRMYKCEYLSDVDTNNTTYFFFHFAKPGIRMDKFRVFSSIGGSGPSMSLVTVTFSSLESSTSHMTVFIILDDASNDISACDANRSSSGRASYSAYSFVAFVITLTNVKSNDAYKFRPLKWGMLVVFIMATYDCCPKLKTYWMGEQVIALIVGLPFSIAIFSIMAGSLDFSTAITALMMRLSIPFPYILMLSLSVLMKSFWICTSKPRPRPSFSAGQ